MAVGGRGGQVIEVTTLADAGPGSLRAAIDASGPRVVVFRVAGTIWLDSRLEVLNPHLTVAGQTAPGGGITIANGSSTKGVMKIASHDVVLRYLRIRPGPGGEADGISIEEGGAYNVIIDHCSISWAVDENVSTYRDAHHTTLQWSIVSEGLDCSTHSEGCHSDGMLIGSQGGHSHSVHHNLFAHNVERNPRVSPDGIVDVVNNLIYNPTFSGGWGPSHVESASGAAIPINYVGNYYKPGVDSGSASYYVSSSNIHQIYLEDNFVPVDVIRPADQGNVVTTHHPAEPVTTTSPQVAYDEILAHAGASRGVDCEGRPYPRRDAVDDRIVADVAQGTGAKIDDPSEVGGYPALAPGTPCADVDHDGMPDVWEALQGLDPNDPADASADSDGDGYSSLDDYLSMATPSPAALPIPALPGAGLALFAGLVLGASLRLRRTRG